MISGALASSIVWLACACQGSPKNVPGAGAPVVWFAAPPLTVLGEPKTWLVRLLRREFWPEIIRKRSFSCVFNASLMMLYLTFYDLGIIYEAL